MIVEQKAKPLWSDNRIRKAIRGRELIDSWSASNPPKENLGYEKLIRGSHAWDVMRLMRNEYQARIATLQQELADLRQTIAYSPYEREAAEELDSMMYGDEEDYEVNDDE